MVNLYRLVPSEFVVHAKFRLNKIYLNKVKDILNIVGFNRSILAVYLQPYTINGVTRNRLKVAFDNFNPSMSYILNDGILDTEYHEIELVAKIGKDTSDMFCRVDDTLHTSSYQNSVRMYEPIPVSMFLGLFLTHFKYMNNTLTYVNIYDIEVSDVVINNLIVGFKEN